MCHKCSRVACRCRKRKKRSSAVRKPVRVKGHRKTKLTAAQRTRRKSVTKARSRVTLKKARRIMKDKNRVKDYGGKRVREANFVVVSRKWKKVGSRGSQRSPTKKRAFRPVKPRNRGKFTRYAVKVSKRKKRKR